jgi:hypothetical protein
MAGILDVVGIMTCSFDDTWVGSVASAFGAPLIDFMEGFGPCVLSMFRGKSPPAQ